MGIPRYVNERGIRIFPSEHSKELRKRGRELKSQKNERERESQEKMREKAI